MGLLPSKRITVFWIGIVFIFSILSITELNILSLNPSSNATDDIELFEGEKHRFSKPLLNLIGLDNIRKELNKTISSLKPIRSDPFKSGYFTVNELPTNEDCEHHHKVFNLGIMKTATTSMNSALESLGYSCYGDSCIHVGNWDFLIDIVHLWEPESVINLSIIKLKDLWKRYLADSYNALNFGDSPWCFLYPIFDKLYPNSKFILSERKDDETYINSYIKYIKGFKKQYTMQGLNDDIFTSLAIRRYHLHNKMVKEYFKNRPNDLLVVTVDQDNPKTNLMQTISDFLGCNSKNKYFPRKNRAGSRGNAVKINQYALYWRQVFNVSVDDDYSLIPYVQRDENQRLMVHFADKDKFYLNWTRIVVQELIDKLDSVLDHD